MGRAQSDTYSPLFTKSDNVNLDETFDRKSALVHVLNYSVADVELRLLISYLTNRKQYVVYNNHACT